GAVVVEPVEFFAAFYVRLQIIDTVDRWLTGQTEAVERRRRRRPCPRRRRSKPVLRVEAAVSRGPIRQRQIVVEADEIDVVVKLIEMGPLPVLARMLI